MKLLMFGMVAVALCGCSVPDSGYLPGLDSIFGGERQVSAGGQPPKGRSYASKRSSGSPHQPRFYGSPTVFADQSAAQRPLPPSLEGARIQETAKGALDWRVVGGETPPQRRAASCDGGDRELSLAEGSVEVAEKLLHYRRALRICPENPEYHNALGELYLRLERKVDAEFEFREALNLDRAYQPAEENLRRLGLSANQ